MKKLNLLVLSSALILGLASCNPSTPAASSSTEEVPPETSSVESSSASETSSADTTDYAALGETAISNISASFDKWASGISTKQTLPTESKVTDNGKEYTFAITYAVSTDAAAHLSITNNGATLKVSVDDEDHAYKNAVTVSASIDGSVKASKSFNVKVSAKTYIDLAKVYEKANNDKVTTRGIVENLNPNAGLIYISSGATSVCIYTSTSSYYSGEKALKVGDVVEVTGKVSIYQGFYEIVPSSTITVVDDDDESVSTPVALTVDGKTDLTNAASIQSRKASFEGYLSSITGTHKKRSKGNTEYECIDAVVYVGSTADGWQSVLIHLESDKLAAGAIDSEWGYSYNAETKKVEWGTDAPKAGQKIKVNGYMSWYNGAQLTDAKIDSKGAWEGEKPSAPEKATVDITIANLNKKTAPESDVAYNVSGIYEKSGDKMYLTDPATGDSILIYGLAASENTGVIWNGLDGYNFVDDSQAETSLSTLVPGEEVTLKALNYYYTGTKTPEIKATLLTHTASTKKYTASIDKSGDDSATVSLSKETDIAYGDEVTVTATAGTEGYDLDSVSVTDAAGKETDITGTMKFKATCVNKVKVTFINLSTLKNVTITTTTLGLGSSSYSTGTKRIKGADWKYDDLGNYDKGIQMRYNTKVEPKTQSACYNTSALPRKIKNVVVTFNENTIYTNKNKTEVNNTKLCLIASGSSALTAGTTKCETTKGTDGKIVYTYTPATTADTYFAFSHSDSSGAVYIDSIVINFAD